MLHRNPNPNPNPNPNLVLPDYPSRSIFVARLWRAAPCHDIPKFSGRDNTDTVAACREHHEEKKDTKRFSSRLLQEYLENLRGLRALRGAKNSGFSSVCAVPP